MSFTFNDVLQVAKEGSFVDQFKVVKLEDKYCPYEIISEDGDVRHSNTVDRIFIFAVKSIGKIMQLFANEHGKGLLVSINEYVEADNENKDLYWETGEEILNTIDFSKKVPEDIAEAVQKIYKLEKKESRKEEKAKEKGKTWAMLLANLHNGDINSLVYVDKHVVEDRAPYWEFRNVDEDVIYHAVDNLTHEIQLLGIMKYIYISVFATAGGCVIVDTLVESDDEDGKVRLDHLCTPDRYHTNDFDEEIPEDVFNELKKLVKF